MANVITYGTFDLFHLGHLRILERAKALCGEGGSLTVVVSSDRFNWVEKHKRCIIPDWQRAEIVKALKCVDKVLFEESWEQKRKDVVENQIDIFVMGDDWKGKFDFLKDLCKVVYLPRTPDISSTQLKNSIGKGTSETTTTSERKINIVSETCPFNEDWDLKPFQNAVLEMFRVFEAFCEKHGWRYWSHGGTTLGALRHSGFIPWDDDFDVIMPREDYNEMVRKIQEELPAHLHFCRGDKESPVLFSKIIDHADGVLEHLRNVTKLDMPVLPFMDIFVLDGLPDSLTDIPRWRRENRRLRLVQAY